MKYEVEMRETRAVYYEIDADSAEEAERLIDEGEGTFLRDEFEESTFEGATPIGGKQ